MYRQKYLKYKAKYLMTNRNNILNTTHVGGADSAFVPVAGTVPILEIYQYEIRGHPGMYFTNASGEYAVCHKPDGTLVRCEEIPDNDAREFDRPVDSDDSAECSSYHYKPAEDALSSSCDIITNPNTPRGDDAEIEHTSEVLSEYAILLNIYKFAKLKNTSHLTTRAEDFTRIKFPYVYIEDWLSRYNLINKKFIDFKNSKEKTETYKIKFRQSSNNPDVMRRVGTSNTGVNYIRQVTVRNNNKIICIGDVHGSIHSFIRLLFRFHKYGILDINTLTINEPYKIIFLGDVVDRGLWGVEISVTLIKLLVLNPGKMYWNSGNHEEKQINIRDGFKYEIDKKYANDKDNANINIVSVSDADGKTTNTLHDMFNDFFGTLSCAIIIHNLDNRQKIWLVHGGLPPVTTHDFPVEGSYKLDTRYEFFNEKDINIVESLAGYAEIKPVPQDDAKECDGYYLVNDITASTIKWTDFDYDRHTDNTTKQISSGCMDRGTGYQCNSQIVYLKFMKENGIHGIIRGHQDNYDNTYIIGYPDNVKLTDTPIDKKLFDNIAWNDTTDGRRYKGPVARVKLQYYDHHPRKPYTQPVVTISTNTEIGRNLKSDSFAMLRFDISSGDILDFSNDLKSTHKLSDIATDIPPLQSSPLDAAIQYRSREAGKPPLQSSSREAGKPPLQSSSRGKRKAGKTPPQGEADNYDMPSPRKNGKP